jgi:hypothetical protein
MWISAVLKMCSKVQVFNGSKIGLAIYFRVVVIIRVMSHIASFAALRAL